MSAPAHLSQAARAVWDDVVNRHETPDRIKGPDLEAYCVQVARMRDAAHRIDTEGLVVADEKGRPSPHPAIAIEKTAQAEVRAWGGQFQPRRPRR